MKQNFVDALAPLIDFLDELDPSTESAASELTKKFPIESEQMQAIAGLFEKGVEEGWLCHHEGGPGVQYSRVAKKLGKAEFSIDAVTMDRPGPGHSHPNGEFDICFAAKAGPTFDGNPPGWTVYGPGSWHVPTVAGGSMNILYFLPGGAIEFGPKPS